MPLPADERAFVDAVHPPAHEKVVARANEFLARTAMTAADFGAILRETYGRCGRSTMYLYLRGVYPEHLRRTGSGIPDTRFMDARVWDFLERNWPKPVPVPAPVPVLETAAYARLKDAFDEALSDGVNALVYGPPSSEKSEVLEHLVAARRAAGHEDAFYLYCDATCTTPLPFLRRLAVALGVLIGRAWMSSIYLDAVVAALASRRALPVIVLDEAQHLHTRTLEIIRAVHDRTRRRRSDGVRRGAGIILAGSHNLFRDIMHPVRRPRLEQFLSRWPTRIQLEGMSREEVLALAGRALGNGRPAKFTPAEAKRLLDSCAVQDPYATGADGRPVAARAYFSARRLLEYIRGRRKNARLSRILADSEVA
jgi:type II secretory pathway predicted ATPase ExeA